MSSNGAVQFVPRGARFTCWPTLTGYEGIEELGVVAVRVVLEASLPMVRSSRWPIIAGEFAAAGVLDYMISVGRSPR